MGLRLDQLQLRESHWVIVDLVGKGGRLRTVPVPAWCKGLVDGWNRAFMSQKGLLDNTASRSIVVALIGKATGGFGEPRGPALDHVITRAAKHQHRCRLAHKSGSCASCVE